jgi:hypothetical protein
VKPSSAEVKNAWGLQRTSFPTIRLQRVYSHNSNLTYHNFQNMAATCSVRGLISVNFYNLKPARRLHLMKCFQASSLVRWLNVEKPTFREHRNVGLLDSQPPDKAASPRIFGRICKFNFLNDLYRAIHLKMYALQKSVSCFFTE